MDKRRRRQECIRISSAMLLILAMVWAAVSLGCNSERPASSPAVPVSEAASAHQGVIVAVGDSLTAGLGIAEESAYPAQLARKLKADGYQFKVINAGVSGETSSGTLARIDWVVSTLRPDIVILETGANDGLRGLDPKLLERNLNGIIKVLKANDIQVILAGMLMLPNLGPEYTRAFAEIYPAVARTHDVALIPFFLQGVAGVDRYNQPDKRHPTAEGYGIVVEHIYGQVVQAVKKHLQPKPQRPTGSHGPLEGRSSKVARIIRPSVRL